jgi:sugar phosphate isomerase/epimerase
MRGAGTEAPKLAAFPKGFFYQLIDRRELTIEDFIGLAPSLGVDGVELYPGFLAGTSDADVARLRRVAEAAEIELPLMCSSPDFINPAPGAWDRAVGDMREMVDVMVELNATGQWRSVRVLSGQAWPGVPESDGLAQAVAGITAVLAYAAPKNVWVVLENHYKDGLWTYPEFARSSSSFLHILSKIESPFFGVNFDPSNAIVAGEDPLELLDRVLPRVRSVGASDRSLRPGYSIIDLQSHTGAGYPEALTHGVVGEGLNDYPAIFSRLSTIGFKGWISIEDGEAGGEQGYADIASSARFLRALMAEYLPAAKSLPDQDGAARKATAC